MRGFLKSLLFNIVFYAYTAFCCFFLVFTFLLPRRPAFAIVRTMYFKGIAVVERIFLGLDYHVEGREHLPESGSYILALKHYSAYETLKLPVIFGDIAIILKRELSWIPFWGWYTIKLGMIPVDRGARGKAIMSLIKGARRVIADGRPILIFPQGTRVLPDATTAEKPYKVGIAKIAEVLKLPVVPVALNSGAFWPKHSFVKKSGIVDFKILPSIPAGLPAAELLTRLEAVLEPESAALMAAPKYAGHSVLKAQRGMPRWLRRVIVLGVVLFLLWAAWWHALAFIIDRRFSTEPIETITSPHLPVIDGFPGAMRITWPDVTVKTDSGTIALPVIEAQIWPVIGGNGAIRAQRGFTLNSVRDGKTVVFDADSAALRFRLPALWQARENWALRIAGIDVVSGPSAVHGTGETGIDIPVLGGPVNGTLDMAVSGYGAFLERLAADNLIEPQQASLARGFFDAMAMAQGGAGRVTFPLSVKNDVVYAGFIRLVNLADMRPPADGSVQTPQRIHFDGSGTGAPPVPALQIPEQLPFGQYQTPPAPDTAPAEPPAAP